MTRYYKDWEAIRGCSNSARFRSLRELDMLSPKARKRVRELPDYFIECPNKEPVPLSLLLEEEHQLVMRESTGWGLHDLSDKLLRKYDIPWDWYRPVEKRYYPYEKWPLLPESIRRDDLQGGKIVQLGDDAMVVVGYYPNLRVKLVPASRVVVDCDVRSFLLRSYREYMHEWGPFIAELRAHYLARFGRLKV